MTLSNIFLATHQRTSSKHFEAISNLKSELGTLATSWVHHGLSVDNLGLWAELYHDSAFLGCTSEPYQLTFGAVFSVAIRLQAYSWSARRITGCSDSLGHNHCEAISFSNGCGGREGDGVDRLFSISLIALVYDHIVKGKHPLHCNIVQLVCSDACTPMIACKHPEHSSWPCAQWVSDATKDNVILTRLNSLACNKSHLVFSGRNLVG